MTKWSEAGEDVQAVGVVDLCDEGTKLAELVHGSDDEHASATRSP